MAKKKKLSECEEKAIVALEAKRIREKEQKQRAREKRKRENETEGPNKRVVIGGQVLPFQTGIQPSVPEQTYASYVTRQTPSFTEQVTSLAVSQAPAALQAYLFMNSGQHRERRQLIRDQQVQAGGNVVGGGERRNLIRAPQFQPVLQAIRARGQVPPIQVRPEPDLVDRAIAGIERGAGNVARGIKKGAGSVARGIKKGGLGIARGIKSAAGELASGAGSAFDRFGNFANRVYDDALKTGRGLQKFSKELEDEERQSLLKKDEDIELDNLNKNSENDMRNRLQSSKVDDEKIDEFMSAEERAEAAKNQDELDNYNRLKDNEAKRQYEEDKAFADRLNAAMSGAGDSIEMQTVKMRSKAVEPLINMGTGKAQQIYSKFLNTSSEIKTMANESLVGIGKSKRYGLNAEGYVVDATIGKYLHPAYKDYFKQNRQGLPDGYKHYDEEAINKLRLEYKQPNVALNESALNKTISMMSMGSTPVKQEQQTNSSFTEATDYDFDRDMRISASSSSRSNVIPNQAVNESYFTYDNFNMNQSRDEYPYGYEPFNVSSDASEFNVPFSEFNVPFNLSYQAE
jgi:hypothetical protein